MANDLTKDVYEEAPIMENERFLLRLIRKEDARDLLQVYSDSRAVPFFNSDNCHGDDFHYTTLERMEQAIAFWEFSYRERYFVRWSIVDKECRKVVGTIELFHRDSEDYFNNCGLLRLDLHSDYETCDDIVRILELIVPSTYDLFYCDKIGTKAVREATERIKALELLGFAAVLEKLRGDGGVEYDSYFVKRK